MTFTENILLKHFNSNRRIKVNTNVSEFVLIIIILQLQKNDYWHFIAFHFRKLKNSKRNYVTHNKKLLIIINTFRIWKHYWKNTKHEITVMCDHNNLKYFMTFKLLTKRKTHLIEFSINFNFKIKQRTKKKNSTNASSKKLDYKLDEIIVLMLLLKIINLTWCEIRKTIINLCKSLIVCKNNEMLHIMTTLTTKIKHDEIFFEFLFTLFENIKRHIETNFVIKIKVFDESNKFKIVDDLVFYNDNRIYISKKTKLEILKKFHNNSTTKHFKRNKTLTLLKTDFID